MAMNKRFAILSGPSGVGKGPLQCAVRKLYPGMLDARPILCTDRAPREGERHGREYYFLPTAFIRSLEKSPDFVVSPVRTDWQAIHLPEVEQLLQNSDLVFAEVFYTFGPVLLERATTRQFESLRVFLLPLPLDTLRDEITSVMTRKLELRGTDSPQKIQDRATAAADEMAAARAYTHRLLNPVGEDSIDEWGECGTRNGVRGTKLIASLDDLGPNARWLVESFTKILRGQLPPGEYSRD